MTTINITKFMEKYELKNIILHRVALFMEINMLNKATEITPTRPISYQTMAGYDLTAEAVFECVSNKTWWKLHHF